VKVLCAFSFSHRRYKIFKILYKRNFKGYFMYLCIFPSCDVSTTVSVVGNGILPSLCSFSMRCNALFSSSLLSSVRNGEKLFDFSASFIDTHTRTYLPIRPHRQHHQRNKYPFKRRICCCLLIHFRLSIHPFLLLVYVCVHLGLQVERKE